MSASLRAWLRKAPQPVAVLCDGKRVDVPRTPRGWSELAETIGTLAPSKVEAIGANGEVLRAKSLESDDPAAAPSAEISDLQHFSKLLAAAYDTAGKSYAPLLDSAMAFIAHQAQRLQSLERELERSRAHATKLQAELLALSVQSEAEPEPSIMGALMQGALAAATEGGMPAMGPRPAAPPKPKPNGRPTPP